jgi:hypothetical protein
MKRRQRQMIHDLREYQLAYVHQRPLRVRSSQNAKYQR